MARLHWLMPSLMVGSLLAGISFAIGHHIFYAKLKNQTVRGDGYKIIGTQLSDQQFNTAVGTAFAFLVRTCLVLATTAAYAQIAWVAVHASSSAPSLQDLDTLFAASSNVLALGNLRAWRRWPVFVIALVAWLVPLASILTPATLSVGNAAPSHQLIDVPTIAFKSLTMLSETESSRWDGKSVPHLPTGFILDGETCWSNTTIVPFAGADKELIRLAAATVAQGRILPLTPPAANSSWSLTFTGPAIKCRSVSDSMRSVIHKNIMGYYHSRSNPLYRPLFWAWTPNPSNSTDESDVLKWEPIGNNSYQEKNMVGTVSPWPLMVSTIPEFTNMIHWDSIVKNGYGNEMDQQWTAQLIIQSMNLRCDLYNATYQTDFSFLNGVQEVEVNVQELDTEPLRFVDTIQIWSGPIAHQLDSVFQFTSTSCDGVRELITYLPDAAYCNCNFDMALVEGYSYQAIMAAFNRQILGSLEKDSWPESAEKGVTPYQYGWSASSTSHILETELAGTPELAFIRPRPIDLKLGDLSEGSIFNELQRPPTHSQQTGRSFGDTLEQLFRNVTVSIMSSPSFRPSKGSKFAAPQTNVTTTDIRNIYIYAAPKLWLAYGLAIAACTLSVVAGMVAIYVNNGSVFSNSFSSLCRLSRGADLSVEIEKEDLDRRDPLPAYLEDANVEFQKLERSKVKEGAVQTLGYSTIALLEIPASRTSQTSGEQESLVDTSETSELV